MLQLSTATIQASERACNTTDMAKAAMAKQSLDAVPGYLQHDAHHQIQVCYVQLRYPVKTIASFRKPVDVASGLDIPLVSYQMCSHKASPNFRRRTRLLFCDAINCFTMRICDLG